VIEKLVAAAVRLPLLVFAAALLVVVGGALSYRELNVEAYPDPVPPMIEVIAQPDGLSAEEVEKYVTIPLEVALAGIPGLDHVRSQSLFGLSDVKVYFRWGTDYDRARQEVLNRLQLVELPPGVKTSLSPWSAIGEVFRYTLEGKGYTLRELKTAQEWVLEREWRKVPGVSGVVSFGGETKEYHVAIDPVRMRAHGVGLAPIMNALAAANQNVGGQRITLGEQSYDIRGVGLLHDVGDIEKVVILEKGGTPVRVRDVATVSVGAAPRLGTVGKDDEDDVVQGTVNMRSGAETASTLRGIHERLAIIEKNRLLPPGMKVRPYYNRGDLVKVTTRTVVENLVVGMLLVAGVLFVFLGNVRAAAITSVVIPLSLMVAFMGLVLTRTSANLISLGAIDFGIVVHSAVIMLENVFQKLGRGGSGGVTDRVLAAAREVAGPMAFSTAIIGVSLLPLFLMGGVSGVIFSPMARTYALAIGGAIVLSLTLAPALATKLLRASDEEREGLVMRGMSRAYHPLVAFGARFPLVTVVVVAAGLAGAGFAARGLGSETMPKLEEGNLWIRATLPTSISREKAAEYANRMRAIVRGCPKSGPCTDQNRTHKVVLSAVSQVGRPDDGTDVTGFNNVEIFAPLLSYDEWPRGMTKESLTAELSQEMEETFPGVLFSFSQMIGDNVEEAVAGVKGENAVKVFGPEVTANEATAAAIVTALGRVGGVDDLGYLRSLGQPNVKVTPDRTAAARYGLNTGDVTAIIDAAVGGRTVTRVYEGERTFDLTVRFDPEHRSSLDAIRELDVTTPSGARVPLGQIAKIEVGPGALAIYREDGQRYTPVKFSVRGRDLATTIEDAQATVARDVALPYGAHLEWSGELDELRAARGRLAWVVPLTLALVTALAYAATRSWRGTLVVFANVPLAWAGGVVALRLAHVHLSVSAAMGFVSLLGIAAQDAILVVTYFARIRAAGASAEEAARGAVENRLRAVLMTTAVAMLGLLPAAVSHGVGSETQKPLALVVIGGGFLLAVIARLLQPALLVLLFRGERTTAATAPSLGEDDAARFEARVERQ